MTDFVTLYVPLSVDDGMQTAFAGAALPASGITLFLKRDDAVAALDQEPFAHLIPAEEPTVTEGSDDATTQPGDADDATTEPGDGDGNADDATTQPGDGDGNADDATTQPGDGDGNADDATTQPGDGDGNADDATTQPAPVEPPQPKLVREDSSLVAITVPRNMFDMMAADGTLLPAGDGQFQLGDPDALKANTVKALWEANAADRREIPDGVTLYAVYCGANVSAKPDAGIVGKDGAGIIVSEFVERKDAAFITDQRDANYRRLRLYATREAAMATVKEVKPTDDVAVLMVTVSKAGFNALITTCQKYPRFGYEVPACLLPHIRSSAILAMELVQQGE